MEDFSSIYKVKSEKNIFSIDLKQGKSPDYLFVPWIKRKEYGKI